MRVCEAFGWLCVQSWRDSGRVIGPYALVDTLFVAIWWLFLPPFVSSLTWAPHWLVRDAWKCKYEVSGLYRSHDDIQHTGISPISRGLITQHNPCRAAAWTRHLAVHSIFFPDMTSFCESGAGCDGGWLHAPLFCSTGRNQAWMRQ